VRGTFLGAVKLIVSQTFESAFCRGRQECLPHEFENLPFQVNPVMNDHNSEQWPAGEDGPKNGSVSTSGSTPEVGPHASPGKSANPVEALAERLAEEMTRRWQAGEEALSEEYLARHPELAEHPEAAILIYEEVCLRQERGQPISAEEILRRFPQWHSQLQVMLQLNQILQPAAPTPRFPRSGDLWDGFRLRAELGRGARGRVFVATQPALGDRPIVLKLTALEGKEHLSLARLQHTNIVPLYAVHDDAARHLRALCMPYFGGATLQQVLDILRDRPPAQRKGRDVLEALEKVQAKARVPVPVNGPNCALLANASYVDALCWIGACLADALQYAQERDLVHLDLKPSNVLIGSDGQPMLLDFHLARAPIQPHGPVADWLGGTREYMAPEQVAAMTALKAHDKITTPVDGRADVYSLGVLLYEALAGKPPADPPDPLKQCNPRVSTGLSDLIGKCLAHDPEDRMPTAAALASDLRRHRADLPLQSVANRSAVERWNKWRRRHPQGLILAGLVVLMAGAAAIVWAHFEGQRQMAQATLFEGRELHSHHFYADAISTYARGKAYLEGVPFGASLARDLNRLTTLADQALRIRELHTVVSRLRFLYEDEVSRAELVKMDQQCKGLWARRALLRKDLGEAQIEIAFAQRVEPDLQDLALLWTELRLRLAPGNEMSSVGQECLEVLDQAKDELFARPNRVLCMERQAVARKAQQTVVAPADLEKQPDLRYWAKVAQEAGEQADKLLPAAESVSERCALGRFWLQHGEVEKALKELLETIKSDSEMSRHENQNPWLHYYKAKCLYRLKQYQGAIDAFYENDSIGQNDPECLAGCHYHQALAFAAQDRLDMAMVRYDSALTDDPKLTAAYVSRGRLHFRDKHYADALTDFQKALDHQANPVTTNCDMARVYMALKRLDRAEKCLATARNLDPKNEEVHKLLQEMNQRK
jgi:serine/threonine protein kinase/tetratricopeptide (TPR) repeat protein